MSSFSFAATIHSTVLPLTLSPTVFSSVKGSVHTKHFPPSGCHVRVLGLAEVFPTLLIGKPKKKVIPVVAMWL